ncbi:MAG: hypothetical protein P9M13_04130 [Candidatus Ancaeobacter aquaticus]|nr:hypothetical protein [Candidatus Ancaeobacter aquaticus]
MKKLVLLSSLFVLMLCGSAYAFGPIPRVGAENQAFQKNYELRREKEKSKPSIEILDEKEGAEPRNTLFQPNREEKPTSEKKAE